jgi:hypothetical protein
MHVGIHSGAFLFVIAGSDHRELIVAGPAATRTVEMETLGTAGEIVVSDATASALPVGVLGAARRNGFLLVAGPPAPKGIEPLPPFGDLPLKDCVPRLIREHVFSETTEPEHRQAVVAFVRLSGVDGIVEIEGRPRREVTRRSSRPCRPQRPAWRLFP